MENEELRELQKLYIQESKAFLECLRQNVSLEVLQKKREKIRKIYNRIDELSNGRNDPSSDCKRPG